MIFSILGPKIKGVDRYWKVGGRASKSWKNTAYIIGPKYHSARGPSQKWKNISPFVRYSFNKIVMKYYIKKNVYIFIFCCIFLMISQSKSGGDIWYVVPSSVKSEGGMSPPSPTHRRPCIEVVWRSRVIILLVCVQRAVDVQHTTESDFNSHYL